MAAARPPVCDFGWENPGFVLPATDGRTYSHTDIAGPGGLLVMFICNHCPYVLRIMDRLVEDAHALMDHGVGVAAICSNDAVTYPADSFANMVSFARDNAFRFPYLHDEDQSVARAFDAACTPDFFGFNAQGLLQYRGRFEEQGNPGRPRELMAAMTQIAGTGRGPDHQVPSMGCSIKWKAA